MGTETDKVDPMMELKESYGADIDAIVEDPIKGETLEKLAAFDSIRQELSSKQFK